MLAIVKLVGAMLATAAGLIGAELMMLHAAAGWIAIGLAAAIWTAAMYHLIQRD